MPETGLEPARIIRPRDFKSLVSTNSTIPAYMRHNTVKALLFQGAYRYFFVEFILENGCLSRNVLYYIIGFIGTRRALCCGKLCLEY